MKKKVPYTDLNRFWRRYRRNRLAVFGLCFLTILVLAALLAEVIAPEGYDAQNYKIKFTSPNWEHPLGTDYLGRDNLVRVIYGARISLSIGVSTTIIGTAIAVFIGMMAGFYGGKSDNILMRIMDVFLSIHRAGLGAGRRRRLYDHRPVSWRHSRRLAAGAGHGDLRAGQGVYRSGQNVPGV